MYENQTDITIGACVDCDREKRGRRCNPPLEFDSNGKAIVTCLAQDGREMPTRTDIEHFTECEHFYNGLEDVHS
jgi:hypothetical protein